jgi:hypothetical protein
MKKENDKLNEYLLSDQFKDDFRKQVEKDTWDKGLPMVYMDNEGYIVTEWKDGRINRIKRPNIKFNDNPHNS